MDTSDQLLDFLQNVYQPNEYPALMSQMREWAETKPLQSIAILDATPLFRNTLLKHAALLKAGAKLTVATHDAIPFDDTLLPLLRQLDIPHVHNCRDKGTYQIILDCGGVHNRLQPTIGFAELTRSGAYHYQDAQLPVILVDDSRIKTIETCLGTGDGFRRGMNHLGYGDFNGKSIVVFGCGKVGRGVAYYAKRCGANVTVIDDATRITPPKDVPIIHMDDRAAVIDAARNAWCLVSVTGRANTLDQPDLTNVVLNGSQIVVNMGVEDEWGPNVPTQRVLNGKMPLNFVLEEPTLLRYIDPTMALLNQAALELLKNPGAPGIRTMPEHAEQKLWSEVEKHGIIAHELADAGL